MIIVVDGVSDTSSSEMKSSEATGVTYVDSDINIYSAINHSESRYRYQLMLITASDKYQELSSPMSYRTSNRYHCQGTSVYC